MCQRSQAGKVVFTRPSGLKRGGKEVKLVTGNTKEGRISVLLTSCLTGLESAVWLLTLFVFICKTDQSKPVKQEVNGTVIPTFHERWGQLTTVTHSFCKLDHFSAMEKILYNYWSGPSLQKERVHVIKQFNRIDSRSLSYYIPVFGVNLLTLLKLVWFIVANYFYRCTKRPYLTKDSFSRTCSWKGIHKAT